MRKLIFAALLLCQAAIGAIAQTEFHWGFKGGMNITTYDSDCDDLQGHMGQWGLLCRWKLNDHFAVQPELFYSKMGVRSLENVLYANEGYEYGTGQKLNPTKFKLHLTTDNMQLPVIFKYYMPATLLEGLNVHAGPLFSVRFDYSAHTVSPIGYLKDGQMGPTGEGINALVDIARAQNVCTAQAVVGVGYDSPTGIGFDFRCQLGITPVFKKNDPGCYNSNSHDRVWAFCFSYVF